MSETISFRLSESDEDEAKALAILQHWVSEGHRPREIITKALLALEGHDLHRPDPAKVLIDELRGAIQEAHDLAATLRSTPATNTAPEPPQSEDALKPEFKMSILKSKRPGFKPKE